MVWPEPGRARRACRSMRGTRRIVVQPRAEPLPHARGPRLPNQQAERRSPPSRWFRRRNAGFLRAS